MNIILYRRRYSRWGVDGTLVIKGVKVCNTLEHPERLLPAGEYWVDLFFRCHWQGGKDEWKEKSAEQENAYSSEERGSCFEIHH